MKWWPAAAAVLGLILWMTVDTERTERRMQRTTTTQPEPDPEPIAAEPSEEPRKRQDSNWKVFVVDRAGQPVPDASVELASGDVKARATTGSDGVAVLQRIPGRVLSAHVDGLPAGVVRCDDPSPRLVVDVFSVRLQVRYDGRRGLPDEFEIEGLRSVRSDPVRGRIEGTILLSERSREVLAGAPGYVPVQLEFDARESTRHRTIDLNRGVRVRIHRHEYVKADLWLRGAIVPLIRKHHYVAPGTTYEVRTRSLRTLIGAVDVPVTFAPIGIHLFKRYMLVRYEDDPDRPLRMSLPSVRQVAIEPELHRDAAKLYATLETGERLLVESKKIVLPDSPVKFTLTSARFRVHPDSVDRVVRRHAADLVFRLENAPLLRWSHEANSPLSASGRFAIFAHGHVEDAAYVGAFEPPPFRSRWPGRGRVLSSVAAYDVAPGLYDVWIEPRHAAPRLVSGVRVDGRDIDLGKLEFGEGATVLVPLKSEEEPGSLQFIKNGVREPGRTPVVHADRVEFHNCRPGDYDWRSGDRSIRIVVPAGAKKVKVPR